MTVWEILQVKEKNLYQEKLSKSYSKYNKNKCFYSGKKFLYSLFSKYYLIFLQLMTPKTSEAVHETIIQWLKHRENFLLITGAAGNASTIISGQKLKKKDAYIKLCDYVNRKHQTSFTDKQIKSKYDWLISKYKIAKEKSKNEENLENLEKLCPSFHELDKLFGNRQNVNPFNLIEPIQIQNSDRNDDENQLSSSLDSVHLYEEPESSKKRQADEDQGSLKHKKATLELFSPFQLGKDISNMKESSSSEPINSRSNSSTKNGKDFTSTFIKSQQERWKLEKEKFEKELEIKQQDNELQNQRFEKEFIIRDEELKLKRYETESNIKLKEREIEMQENCKKEEVKQTKIQLVKDMLSQGRTKEEIKEILEMLD